MQRINVVGTSGSGKSTFAKRLAHALSLPYIEMDALNWGPNWTEAPEDVFLSRVRRALIPDAWVLDGNYGQSRAIKWERATTVIWLDYNFFTVIYQVTKRAIIRAVTKQELWPGTGNVETFRKTFLEKDSIILWSLTSYHRNRRNYTAFMQSPDYASIQWIRLRSHREATAFLSELKLPVR
ncbi:MAG: adenylate kinase [Proteobacteria bacterium]|nr:MAG: adenylate kinase [Pseudomonadota bacterium]